MNGIAWSRVAPSLTDHVEEALGRVESQLKQGAGTRRTDGLDLLGLGGIGRVVDRYGGRTGVRGVEPRSRPIGTQPADCRPRIGNGSLEYRRAVLIPGVNPEFVHSDKPDIKLACIGIGPQPQRQGRGAADGFRRGKRLRRVGSQQPVWNNRYEASWPPR